MRVVLAPGCGLPPHRARPFARPAPAPTPSLGPVAVVGPRPMEPLRPGCPGPLYASAELRPPGSSPCSMAQVMMAYVPPDEDPDVDGPVDFEPDAWELADLARWDGRTSRPEARRFAFAKGPVLGTRVIACAQARVQ